MSIFTKIFKNVGGNPLVEHQKRVEQINALEPEFIAKTQDQLEALTNQWKEQLKDKDWEEQKVILDEILPQAFAAVREAGKRTLGQRAFDVQLIGGMVLHAGSIAEMRTGEGKTLSATLAMYLNALAGRGAHLVTVNDYLARWQASWMGAIYHYLGLTVASIQHEQAFMYDPDFKPEDEQIKQIESRVEGLVLDAKHMRPIDRKTAYACDITYGTNNEYGFDYLRDNMVWQPHQMAQRELHFAIVDEVDSILIDEARTPLIISAPDTDSTDKYFQFAKVVDKLTKESDYKVDEKHRNATLTEEGIAHLEKILGLDNIYDHEGITTIHHIEQALRARALFKKDVHYVVRNDEIVIVDEFTGRLMYGRRYSEGLHQAIEAKENVKVQQESKTLATITFQNYFRIYHKLGGMTGTAETEAEEFHKIYKLEVVPIPTNKPMIRKDLSDSVYKSVEGKYKAIVKAVKERYDKGQPVLIGTISIEKNEILSQMLHQAGVQHELLNAKNHEHEAHIIAQAGRYKAVTLATNIAGRGVDIILGGNPPNLEEQAKIIELGGLVVIGTERHESRRIDNQLRGRAGRQGDPGESQFFLSLEDDLMRLFGGDRVASMMESLGIPEDQPIEHGLISRTIESAQRKIEGLNFDTRKHVLEYDDVMNKQRTVVYNKRKDILHNKIDLKEQILNLIDTEITTLIQQSYGEREVDIEGMHKALSVIYPVPKDALENENDSFKLTNKIVEMVKKEYEAKEQKVTPQIMREIEKMVYLRSIDMLWQEHLDTMENLRDSVRLRGYGQRDPLLEFKKDGYELFERLLAEIDRQIVYMIFHVDVAPAPQKNNVVSQPQNNQVGRNDPCPCGSGKKYKKCHGK
jgi:preprotein translocase subunit SecA